MNQVQPNTYTLAWFKLAEFVARREKERALGIYRLLVHSLPDEAIAAQLEGDLLLAFNDKRALICYEKAALLYEQAQKYTEVIAVYEHCILIIHTHSWAKVIASEKYYTCLIRALMCAGKVLKAVQVLELCAKRLLEVMRDKETLALAYMFSEEYLTCVQLNAFYEQTFFSILERLSLTSIVSSGTMHVSLGLPDYIKEHIAVFIKRYIDSNSVQQFNGFLSRIAALNKTAHDYALETAQTLKI